MTAFEAHFSKLNPVFNGKADALAFACHCLLLDAGFVATDGNGNEAKGLGPDWNAGGVYCFQYRHQSSSMTYIVKMVPMDIKMVILGMPKEDPKVQQIELSIDDYVSSNDPVCDSMPLL